MTAWCLTTSPENFTRTADLGWTVQGVKSRRRRAAADVAPGDRLVYYLTKVAAFAATVEVTSACFEDHTPVWASKPGEDYPWRFEIRPEVVLDEPDRWVPAEDLLENLEFPRRWPRQHWRLAFQGNIRAWPDADYRVVRTALEAAAGRRE
jgi:hypothetical protein